MTEQQVNGNAAAGAAPEPEPVPASERVMGLFGMAFAAAVFAIGLDLLTGGKVLTFLGAGAGALGSGMTGQAGDNGQSGA